MELIHESGAAFSLYEKSGTGYVGCLLTSEQKTIYYEIDPSKVTDEEVGWPDSDYQLVELAVLPLQNAGWQLTYYDEKHTKRQMYEFFNGEGISGFDETP